MTISMTKLEAQRKKWGPFVTTGDVKRPKTLYSIGPLSVNLAIGNQGGVPGGRFIQIFGKPSVGKSTLVLDTIRQWQQRGDDNVAMYVDFERAYDEDYAEALGVDTARLLISRTDTTEQSMDVIEDAVACGIKLIVVDSIPAGMPASELEKGYGDNPQMARNAGLWTRFANRMMGRVDNNDVLVILVNQMRKNFNTMSREQEIPWGGLALQYASSVNIALVRTETKDNHITIEALIKKNKVGNPQIRAEFMIAYGKGIRHDIDLITLAKNAGVITLNGAWYTYKDYKGQGIEGAAANLPLDEIRDVLIAKDDR